MDAKDAEVAFYVAEADKATTGLRAAVVRKVASSMCADRHEPSRDGRYCGACVWDSARALDVVLDVLADRADEWDRLASAGESTAEDLIAVLRGDT